MLVISSFKNSAFIGLFRGENFDKMLVKIGTEAAVAI